MLEFMIDDLRFLPKKAAWIFDILALVFFIITLLRLAVIKKFEIKRKYLIFFLVYVAHLGLGALFNKVPAGAIIAGIRTYFRYMPLFFLPSVLPIKKDVISNQLKLLFIFSILQVPIAIYQRLFQFSGIQTGDVISGTLTIAPFLTLFQISAISFLLAIYVRGKLKFSTFCLYSIILFIPCTINETKAVIVLLPASLLAISFFARKKDLMLKRIIIIPSILVLLFSIFIPIYDHFIYTKWGYGIIDFMQMDNRVSNYLYKGASGDEDDVMIGRFDSIAISYNHISKDPILFAFGYGMGNVLLSFSDKLKGNHMEFDALGARNTLLTAILWETGIVGFLLLSIFITMIFWDALQLQQATTIAGDIALSWIGVGFMLCVSIVYLDLLHHNIGFLIAYFSGYVSAEYSKFYKQNA